MAQWMTKSSLGILCLALVGCGGGGGGDGGSDDNSSSANNLLALYSGNQQDAQLDSENVGIYMASLFGPQSVTAMPGQRVQATVRAHMAQAKLGRKKIDEQLTCESGQAHLSGELNDKDGRGTLTLVYQNCENQGVTLSGRQITKYERWDLNSVQLLDYTQSYENLQSTSAQGQQTLNGSVQIRGEGSCNASRVENLLLSRTGGDDLLLDKLTIHETCYADTAHPNLALTRRSISGHIYDGSQGRVSIRTSSDYTLGQIINPFLNTISILPMDGSLHLESSLGQATLTARRDYYANPQSEYDFIPMSRLDMSWDGAASHSLEFSTFFVTIAQMQDYADSDNDGLFNGWERFNGSDPLRADAEDDPDGDGVNNQLEYDLGTLGGLQQNTLPAAAVVQFEGPRNPPYYDVTLIAGQTATLPLTVSADIDKRLIQRYPTADLVVDISTLSGAQPSASGQCQVEDNNRLLRCANVDLSQFKGIGQQVVTLGSLTVTPEAGIGMINLAVSWQNGLPIRAYNSSNIVLDIQ